MFRTLHIAVRATILSASVSIVACRDITTVTDPAARPSPGTTRAAATGVVRDNFDIPVSFEGPLDWVTCLDPNNLPLAHVNGVVHVSTRTTPSGTTATTTLFEIDRDNTWVLYNGLTYHVARGRPGKDDITHVITRPDGLYIETGVEPDFEVTDDPSQRLRLNFHWQIVITPNGETRVAKSTGACPWNVF
jgi:hypothetical protein